MDEKIVKDSQCLAKELVNDCISRQAAIDALDVLCQEHRYRIPGNRETYSQYNEAWQDALDRAEGVIFNLPSAQPDVPDTNVGDIISRQAVKHLDLFTKTYCRDKSVKDDLAFRCNQCDFQLPDGTCLVKTMARKLCPDYREFGSMGDL